MDTPKIYLRFLYLFVLFGFLAACDQEGEELQLREDPILGGEECLAACSDLEQAIILDFDEFEENETITESKGIKIFGGSLNDMSVPMEVRVFDTDRTMAEAMSCPTFDDDDLLFPGGPFGNVIVVQDMKSPDCANDFRKGGQVRFVFDEEYPQGVTINCLDLLDTEDGGAVILFARDDMGNLVEIGDPIKVPNTGDGEAQVLNIGVSGVAEMIYVEIESGAIGNICFTPDEQLEPVFCPPGFDVLDFDDLEPNQPIDMIDGIMVSGYSTPAIAFDTENPDRCADFDDEDMVFEDDDEVNLGNVLTNQHRSKTDCANADPRGGDILFTFPTNTNIRSMVVVDIDENEEGGLVSLYGNNDNYLGSVEIPITGDGNALEFEINQGGVRKMIVHFAGSGGLDLICYNASQGGPALPEYEGCTYDLPWWKQNIEESCLDLDAIAFCDMSYRDILLMSSRGRAYNILAQQYVTALLNVSCNGAPFELVEEPWTAAGELLNTCEGVGPEADELIARLKQFNNGLIGPGTCE